MTSFAHEQKCLVCAGRGIDRLATRGNACDDCWRKQFMDRAANRGKATKENGMPIKSKIDWSAVQKERDAGATTTALAAKYFVSTPTICAHTHEAKNGNGPKAAAGRKLQRSTANGGVTHEGMQLADIIAGLKKRRDGLNVAIEALEA